MVAVPRYTGAYAIDLVTDVGQAVRDALIADGADVDRFCPVVPGQIAWDACECGQLAQTINPVNATASFPTPANDQRRTACGPSGAALVVTLSLTRCVQGVDDNGNPPSCSALLADATRLENDRYIVRRTVACYLKAARETYRILDFTVGTASSVGPEGGCAGVELTYQIGLHDFCCD